MTAGKTSTLALLFGSFLVSAAALEAAPCTPSNTMLCLSAQRFSVEVRWTDFAGNTGAGRGVTLTPDTGYFWFFSDNNVELVVKVLDARSFNNHFWVFFGALSNVEYTLTVTDTETGASKTYQNPSGQFASVGDTAAFTGSAAGGIVAHATVVAEGTPAPPESLAALQRVIDTSSAAASQDFTPCASIGRTLRLSACRFSLEVSWRDSQGREGRGTPVQLTNDTGYFWFFSPSNVELVIKVLDAKSINDSHWVFYGALSNVQYTLTVTDSMTGAVRFYTNPNGTFASVGDTGAFHAGRSVGAVPDSSRTAFATFDSSGGTLSATGPDGTQYELELPPDALGMEMTVRMTPLARVDRLPLSRGLVGAVQLEPEGLRLFVPATLRIRPPHPLRKGIVGFSYHGPGEDFALDLGEASNGEVRVPVLHFSGAGAGAAGAGDTASQTASRPLDTIAYIRQLVLEIVDRAQEHEDENGDTIPPEITLEERYELIRALFIDVVNNVLLPRLSATLPDCHRTQILDAATLALATIQTIQLFTDVDQDVELKALVDEVIAKIIHILNQCLEKFFKDCKAHKDPFIAWDMVMIMRQLELFGVDVGGVLDQGGYIERCLRFRMVFDSAFDFNLSPGYTRRRAYATAKLRMDASMSTQDIAWSGTGRINLTELRFDYDGCSTRILGTTESTFEVGKRIPTSLLPMAQTATIASDPDLFTSFKIRVGYDPGDPQDSHSYTCDGATTTVPMLGSWRPSFEAFHANEIKNGLAFLAEQWDVFNLNGLYARANYQRSNHPFIEDTVIVIEHTPDDPDP